MRTLSDRFGLDSPLFPFGSRLGVHFKCGATGTRSDSDKSLFFFSRSNFFLAKNARKVFKSLVSLPLVPPSSLGFCILVLLVGLVSNVRFFSGNVGTVGLVVIGVPGFGFWGGGW